MVKILKSFHIYWNTLRANDNLDQVKENTKKAMKSLLQAYDIKEKFLFEVTKTLVDKIRLAYGKFYKANQSLKIIKTKGPQILSEQIVNRYKHSINQIKFKIINYLKFTHELSIIATLCETYNIAAYRLGFNEEKIK